MEIWKDIPDYEGIYECSTIGRVRRKARLIHNFGIHNNIVIKQKILKLTLSKNWGYFQVALVNKNRRQTKTVHKLVLLTFKENPENKPQGNHINGIKTDNRLENLEWCTLSENQKHAWDTNLRSRFNQANHPKSKKVINTVTGKIYDSIKDLSVFLGVKHSTLRCKLNGTNRNDTIYKII